MSDSPNSTPPSNSPNRTPGDANGFNWRVLGLMVLATVILGVAFFNPITKGVVKPLTYSQFRQAWDQERIVLNDPKRPLKVITTDTSFDATITGWINPAAPDLKPDSPKEDFQVPVNLTLQREEINELLGDNIQFKQIATVAEKPVENSVKTLSFSELRKSLASNWVEIADAGNPLRVLTIAASPFPPRFRVKTSSSLRTRPFMSATRTISAAHCSPSCHFC